jgi:hypothetical protein
MTAQIGFFGETVAYSRHTDPDTSREAAATVDAGRGQRLVLVALSALGTASDEQIVTWLHEHAYTISDSGARSRRAELAREGKVVLAGIGKTVSGRATRTWRAP